ncbi:MAG: radical SAM protein [Anaerolineae bacterium]
MEHRSFDGTSLQREAWRVREASFPPTIIFTRPWATLPVTVTGTECALQCAHCSGRYLAHMRSLSDPALVKAKSLLISGGCDAEGRVPVAARLQEIIAVGEGKRLNWHLGLPDEAIVKAIAPYADVVSMDWVTDDTILHEVYGLHRSAADYVAAYSLLRQHCTVVPHLTIGVHGGIVREELRALQVLKELGAESLVCNVFIPTPGTPFADRDPPPLEHVVELLASARILFPTATLLLGCMRPGGEYREQLDAWAVRLGMNVIVNPARTALRAAAEMGLAAEIGDECCVLEVRR